MSPGQADQVNAKELSARAAVLERHYDLAQLERVAEAGGLPGFQFIQDARDYSTRPHHSNLDTYERLDPDDLKQAAVVLASVVYGAAMRDEKLPRPPLPTPSAAGAVPAGGALVSP